MTVTDYLHGFIVVHLIEDGKLAVGLHFEDKCQSGSQQDSDENPNGFKEYGCILMEPVVFIERNANGENARYQEDNDEGIGEFSEKFLPERFLFRRCQQVYTILLPVEQHLLFGKTSILLFHSCFANLLQRYEIIHNS